MKGGGGVYSERGGVELAFFSLQSDKNHCGDIYSRNLSDIFKSPKSSKIKRDAASVGGKCSSPRGCLKDSGARSAPSGSALSVWTMETLVTVSQAALREWGRYGERTKLFLTNLWGRASMLGPPSLSEWTGRDEVKSLQVECRPATTQRLKAAPTVGVGG